MHRKILYSLFSILFSLFPPHPTRRRLLPTPYTLHPTRRRLLPTPYTLHDGGFSLHPTPYTLHPAPHYR
ncbi:hypothetical protein [Planktothricoides raciborskii]|uniref:Uncharacterized protein n=1 Tax=Planktothricoides raciborskii FACHB-1370 TaxID=2949576 RepID=A0ABR8EBW6_9CYAN|nr:hypothetical protein [Planktothricoides raciborskii]MBD2544060.1 hypothetical protein [Planktothricoides raciborskii FACHB-1370]MBD2582545.1 hypothetical protein [Planktothricoides raciborskii FACHB-1261]